MEQAKQGKQTKVTVGAKIYPHEKAVLLALADRQGMSISDLVREVLRQHISSTVLSNPASTPVQGATSDLPGLPPLS